MKSLDELKNLWDDLGNICVNDDNEIETGFLHFGAGTDLHDIWHWFEDQNSGFSVASMMGLK